MAQKRSHGSFLMAFLNKKKKRNPHLPKQLGKKEQAYHVIYRWKEEIMLILDFEAFPF